MKSFIKSGFIILFRIYFSLVLSIPMEYKVIVWASWSDRPLETGDKKNSLCLLQSRKMLSIAVADFFWIIHYTTYECFLLADAILLPVYFVMSLKQILSTFSCVTKFRFHAYYYNQHKWFFPFPNPRGHRKSTLLLSMDKKPLTSLVSFHLISFHLFQHLNRYKL